MRVGVGLPRATSDMGTGAVVNLLKADSWLAVKPDGQVAERIVTDWSWDQPRTTLRLKLRPNVYFHDGTLLTPEVAAATLRATLTSSDTSLSFNSIRAIHGEGTDTLVIELKERNAFILSDLGGTLVTKPTKPDIGTGPFQVVGAPGHNGRHADGLSQILPRAARPRRHRRQRLSDPAQRVVGADARRHRHALRSQPRRRRLRPCGKQRQELLVPSALLHSAGLQRAAAGLPRSARAPGDQRGRRSRRARARRHERPRQRRRRADPAAALCLRAAGDAVRILAGRRTHAARRGELSAPEHSRAVRSQFACRSRASCSPTIRGSNGSTSWCNGNSPTSASRCGSSRCRSASSVNE